jgi:hypothetical protein
MNLKVLTCSQQYIETFSPSKKTLPMVADGVWWCSPVLGLEDDIFEHLDTIQVSWNYLMSFVFGIILISLTIIIIYEMDHLLTFRIFWGTSHNFFQANFETVHASEKSETLCNLFA